MSLRFVYTLNQYKNEGGGHVSGGQKIRPDTNPHLKAHYDLMPQQCGLVRIQDSGLLSLNP